MQRYGSGCELRKVERSVASNTLCSEAERRILHRRVACDQNSE